MSFFGGASPGRETTTRRVLHGLGDPVVPILLLAAFFEELADNSVHALFLGGVGVVL